ncbi:hypothetical protein LCGC14_0701600 [marine sediment metagenome]|uniref:Uncharacterized protein n=1 Tax=marine sediment metagenome TaxID=412755 RepID=A0A0F9R337_9ZZZZ
MKIIGETNNGYIVSIQKQELEKLTGYYYNKSKFDIGDVILIDKLYDQLTKLVEQPDEIKKMSISLKQAAGRLEKIDPVFHER